MSPALLACTMCPLCRPSLLLCWASCAWLTLMSASLPPCCHSLPRRPAACCPALPWRQNSLVHVVNAPLAAGDAVGVQVDWRRRYDHMQQHTGEGRARAWGKPARRRSAFSGSSSLHVFAALSLLPDAANGPGDCVVSVQLAVNATIVPSIECVSRPRECVSSCSIFFLCIHLMCTIQASTW